MVVSKKLRISQDWRIISDNNGNKLFDIIAYSDCQFHDPEKDDRSSIELCNIDLPVPSAFASRNIDPSNYLLVFKEISKSEAQFVWLYDMEKSVLYNSAGELPRMTDFRRFAKLLCNFYRYH